MDGKEDDLNFMFDDFYYNPDKQGREVRRRSSILKQTKNLNFDLCELEETEVRRRANSKRVSFADTFQVKEYPTGNIYDIPGRHELEASKNSSSSQVGLCLEADKDNIGAVSRELNTTLSFIDHEEVAFSKENCVGNLAISFLEAEKENLGFVAKDSAPDILNIKTSSELNSKNSKSSKTLECRQNVQNNLPTKSASSTISSFVYDPEQLLNRTRATADDMDITSLPSPKAENYPDETNNKTRFTVNDMEMTCVADNVFDESSASLPSNDIFLPEKSYTSYDDNENDQLILGKLNMVAPVSKKELGLNSIIPAFPFESIKLKSHPPSNSGNSSFLANTDSLSLGKISKQHPKSISGGCTDQENVKLPSSVKGAKTNLSEISMYEEPGMGVGRAESQVPGKEKFTFDESSHYSQNSIHGAKFMKTSSEKENSQNRIQVFSSEKLSFPMSSTAFLEDKENMGCSRKRRSTETSHSEVTDALINKGKRLGLTDVKPLCLNTEIDSKTNRDESNHLIPHITSLDIKNHCNYLSEDLNLKDQKCLHPLFDQKSIAESPKAPQFEHEGMELTSIAGNDDSHFIDDDSFKEKEQKESDKSLHLDNSLESIGIGRTCHYASDKMELTCASKYNVELKERSSISSLNNVDEYHSGTLSASNSHPFHKDIQSKNPSIHHLASIGKENMPLDSIHNQSNNENQFKKYSSTSLNNYQSNENDLMNQTLISHEMQLTCTIKTSVTSPFFNNKRAYLTKPSENCSPDFKARPLNSDEDLKVTKDPSNLSKQFFCNEMNNSILLKEKFVFQSNTMDITCNTESSVGESFNFGNSKNYNPAVMFEEANPEFSLHKKLSLVDNHKTCRFDSDGMELTCVASDNEFSSINEDSSELKAGKESANDLTSDHNIKFLDNSRTHHFVSDKMDLTCTVKNSTDFKKAIIDEPFSNSHGRNLSSTITSKSIKFSDNSRTHHFTSDKMDLTCAVKNSTEKVIDDDPFSNSNGRNLSSVTTSESSQRFDKAVSQTNQLNVQSLEVGKNMILNSVDRGNQYENYPSLEAFASGCKSSVLVDGNNLSLTQIDDDKCSDKTFNSHDMELTLMTDKSHKLQASPFFHLSSQSSSTSEEKNSLNFQSRDDYFHKKFHVTQTYLSSLTKNVGEKANPPVSIPCDSPDNKILQTEQPSDSVLSEGNGWDIVLKPINSKDASFKMPLGLQKILPQTPGAVYTLRKKRQQIMKNLMKECILSPEVKNILKRSEKFKFNKPFSEMKAYSPVKYDSKKSLTFHSFGMDGSFTAGLDESDKIPSVQPYNSSHKALNENCKKTSLTSAPTGGLLEDNLKTGSKEVIQVPTGQSFNLSLKAMNGNCEKTSLTPAPTGGLLEDNFKTGLKEVIHVPSEQSFNSSLKAMNENCEKTSLTPAPTGGLLEDNLKTGSKEVIHVPTGQSFNSSLKAMNENCEKTSLTPATTGGLLEDNLKTGSKEIIHVSTGQSFNSSLKAMNETSGMTSITSLIPAPTSAFTSFVRSEANLSRQSNKISILEEKSKNFSCNENDSLGLLSDSVLDNTKFLPEKSLLKNESCSVPSAKQDLLLPSETSGLNLDFEKNINVENPYDDLPLSIHQKEIELKDPLLRSESESLNLKTSYNVQNHDISEDFTKTEMDLKCNKINTTFIPEERKLNNVSLNSKSHDGQRVMDFIMSEGSAQESTKSTNSSKTEINDLQKTHDVVALKKARIEDKISDISGCLSNFEVEDDKTSRGLVSKMAVKQKEVSEQPKNPPLKTSITNSINLPEVKVSDCHEKSSPEKTSLKIDSPKQSKVISFQSIPVHHLAKNDQELNSDDNNLKSLEIDCPKQSEDMNIQIISVHHPAKNDHELNSGDKGMKSSSNEISTLKNNSFMNPCNRTASLSGNSSHKTSNQKTSDPNQHNGMEIDDDIWRTPNADESMQEITAHANKSESSKDIHDMPTSDYCNNSGLDLDSLRNKFEERSKGTHWKIKSLKKEDAVFKLKWKVWLYKCRVNIHIKGTIFGESSITLTPCLNDPDDELEIFGYKCFQFLAKDGIVPFSLDSNAMIEKLIEYSNIAERVETLMRDILHVSVDVVHTLSDDLDPLELAAEILNNNHKSQFLITFQVNLRTYPSEKIIPEVKHLNFTDITNKVKEAITNVEPGEDYLWNMIKVASNL